MKTPAVSRFLCATLVASLPFAARPDVKLAGLFTDDMVLQQGIEVPVWGSANDGEKVTVEIQGQQAAATADNGKWMVRLEPLKAGGPFEMRVSGKSAITLRNVMVGEVWVCGGQSNMAFGLSRSEGGDEAAKDKDNAWLRFYQVTMNLADKPGASVSGAWAKATSESALKFSAVGYHFGLALAKAHKVPIGLISANVGGTNAVCWMSTEASRADPAFLSKSKDKGLAKENKEQEQASAAAPAGTAATSKAVTTSQTAAAAKAPLLNKRGKPVRPKAISPATLKRPSGLYYGMISPLQPYAIKGVIWYQGEANASEAVEYRKLFPALIANWRKDWGQGDFPFLFVQLAAYEKRQGPAFPFVRESQLLTLSVPYTAMAVTIDVGDRESIHPTRKKPVGERLALAARS